MRLHVVVPLVAALVVSACSANMNPSTTSDSGAAPAPSFSQFTDIPIPDGARMDVEKTLLLGQGDNWVGRLVFNLRWSNAPALFDFYKAQMPGYKWQEISSVRAAISVMTYQRDDRIATVQIEDTTLGAQVILTMGPVNARNPSANSSSQPPPAAAQPTQSITTQPLK